MKFEKECKSQLFFPVKRVLGQCLLNNVVRILIAF